MSHLRVLEGGRKARRRFLPKPKQRYTAEDIARLYRVPYWFIEVRPRPPWWRRPVWRFRAWRWSR